MSDKFSRRGLFGGLFALLCGASLPGVKGQPPSPRPLQPALVPPPDATRTRPLDGVVTTFAYDAHGQLRYCSYIGGRQTP